MHQGQPQLEEMLVVVVDRQEKGGEPRSIVPSPARQPKDSQYCIYKARYQSVIALRMRYPNTNKTNTDSVIEIAG